MSRTASRLRRRSGAPGAIASLVVLLAWLAPVPIAGSAPGHARAAAAPAQATTTFPDVPADDAFAGPIGWAVDNGVATGRADGTFDPTGPVTRKAFAALLALYWVSPGVPDTCTDAPFPDVPTTDPLCPAITWAADRGIITGRTDGTFDPTAPITRHSAAGMVHRLRGQPLGPDPTCDTPAFDDITGLVFCAQIGWHASAGTPPGAPPTSFDPGRPVSRQVAVAMVDRIDPGCAPATEPTGGCPRPAVDGDYDGDRRAELMWTDVTLLQQGTDRTQWFDGDASTPYATIEVDVRYVALDGDFDGDGRWEPALLGADDDLHTAGGRGSFDPARPDTCGETTLPLVGDWDGDRTDDVAWYCPSDATWHLPGEVPVTFGIPDGFSEPDPRASHPSMPAPADYDGDGSTDIATYEPMDGTFRMLTPDGPITIGTGFGYGYAVGADVDGDGEAEPVVLSLVDGAWERSGGVRGAPTYAAERRPTHDGPYPVVTDHDGDGDADLGELDVGGEPTGARFLSEAVPAVDIDGPPGVGDLYWIVPTTFPTLLLWSRSYLRQLAQRCDAAWVGPPPRDGACPADDP